MQDHQVPLIYPNLIISQVSPQQVIGEQPKRRRKKRSSGERNGSTSKKRKLSEEQVSMLELSFGCEHKLESERKDKLASELGLDSNQVAVWFQNRRARWKNKKIEVEYSKLRNQNDNLMLEKCHLQTQVMDLKDELSEAKKEIQRLLERSSTSSPSMADNGSSNSPSSSSLTGFDHNHANLMDPNQLAGDDDFGFMTGYSFDAMFFSLGTECLPTMDWVNLYQF